MTESRIFILSGFFLGVFFNSLTAIGIVYAPKVTAFIGGIVGFIVVFLLLLLAAACVMEGWSQK